MARLLAGTIRWVISHVREVLIAAAAALGLGFVFLPGDVGLRALLPRADHEVTALVEHPGVRCVTWQGRDSCSASWSVRLGNTGTEPQELVIVTLSGVSEGLRPPTWRVQDLEADVPRAGDPEVDLEWDPATHTQTVRIHDLAPGTYLEVDTADLSGRQSDELGRLEPAFHVEATGRVLESDPQGTTFGRRVFQIFGG